MVDIRILDNTLRYDEYDHIFMIVRSNNTNNPKLIWYPELAPSSELFFMYRKWVDEGIWTQETFDEKYVPWFLRDLVNNKQSRDALNTIYGLDKEGKRVCLLCYCGNEKMCHRSIIAGLLQGVGANVRLVPDSNSDYSRYWDDYNYLRRTLGVF